MLHIKHKGAFSNEIEKGKDQNLYNTVMNMPDKANERDSSLPGALTEYGGFLGCWEKWHS